MNEWLENPTEDSEHETKRKIPTRKMEIRMGTTVWPRFNIKEGKIWGKMEELWDDRNGWRGSVAR
jgi:hypothetical protein